MAAVTMNWTPRALAVRAEIVVTLKNLAICWKIRLVSDATHLVLLLEVVTMRSVRTISRKDALVNPEIARVPPEIGYYLAGFTDGEGSFNISFRPRPDFQIPWKVSVSFNVSQKDEVILALFKKHLGCGTLRSRTDGVWYFEVTNLDAVSRNVIPFFERFGFLSAKKQRDFSKFKQIVALMKRGEHLTK